MANRKLNSIKFPDIADTYILDAGKVEYHETDTFDADTAGKALQNKANIDGSYDSMTVGNAEQLVSNVRVNDKTPYLFRTSGGSVDIGDREYINGIVGGTVAWNQLVQNGNFASTTGWYQSSCSLSVSDNVATVTASAQWGRISSPDVAVVQGHKYFVSADVKGTTNNYVDAFGFGNKYITQASVWQTMSLIVVSPQTTPYNKISIGDKSSSNWSAYNVKNVMCIDLTQMFGSTIADYIYSLETANAGAGVAWFKKLFNKPYYAYNAGELKSVSGLVSHDMTGFNQWDEEWEAGYCYINNEQLVKVNSTTCIRSKNYIPVLPNTAYYGRVGTGKFYRVIAFDADKNWISTPVNGNNTASATFTTPSNCAYILFHTDDYGNTYLNDICINISWDGSRDGEYEEYELHSYPLDSDVVLRGIPKLDTNNKLYYDGDVYETDGTVTRKYGTRTIDGTENNTWYFNTQGDCQGVYTSASFLPNVNTTDRSQDMMCDIFVPSDVVNTKRVGEAYVDTGWFNMLFAPNTFSTSAEVKTWLTTHNVTLVYELAAPTTETADPYQEVQIINDFGTEEYVIDSTVPIPVGHDTDYPINLVAKLEMVPNSPDANGDYVLRHNNGDNAYVPLVVEDVLPTIPSTDGTYMLTVTVAEGSDPVLGWEEVQ